MFGRECWLALASVEGVGPMRIQRLLDRFGTIDSVFEAALPEIARLPLFNPLLAARIFAATSNGSKIVLCSRVVGGNTIS